MNPVWQRKMPRKFHLALIRKFQPYSWFLTVKARPLANQSGKRYAERFASDQSNVQVVYMDAPHDLYHYQNNELVSRIEEFLTE